MSTTQKPPSSPKLEAKPKSKTKLYLQWIIAFGVPLIFFLMPATPVLTKPILKFLAITSWAVASWVFGIIPEVVVGFILPVLYIVVGVATAKDAFSPWLTNVPWISFGGLILTAMMMTTGLASRVAYKAILITGGSYKRTIIGLMLGGLVVAPLIPSIIGKAALFAIIGVSICQALNLEPQSKTASGIMLGAFLAVAGPKLSYLTGAGDGPLAMGLVAKVTGTMITWGEFALHNAIIGVIYSFLALFVLFLTIKPDKEFDSIDVIKTRYQELGPMSGQEKKAAVFLGLALLLMVTDFLHKVDVGWVLMMVAAAAFIPGVGVLKVQDLNKTNFAMVFFVAGAMSIGPIAGQTGIVKLAANTLIPMLQGSSLYTYMCVYFFGVVLKFFLTPLAAVAMFTTTIAEIALQLGIHPYLLVYVFKYGVDQYLFPYEYAVLLYVYSFGYMSLNSIIRVMLPRMFVTGIFLVLIAYPYWKWCGL
ncbi:MAG: sodium:sulfate symporter [Firmicutes bacterium]|nr:sodium:sulfate symporter [Bacillota bacterium]